MTLRLRLSMLAVVLVAAGLLAAGIATRYELRGFLIDRVDSQLKSAANPVSLYFLRGDTDAGAQGQVQNALPRGSYTAVVASNGSVLASLYFDDGSVPANLKHEATQAPLGTSTQNDYRVYVIPGQANGGSAPVRLAIATPLHDVNSTLNRLAMLELLVGLIVLAVVAAIAFWLVRRELRPLVRIEDTAAAIAGGDLTQRVPEEAPGTEVGDLARSLNLMLAQIEQAFEQRRQSEERLRRFVSDASHELRTPLTSVRGFAELFHRGAASRPDDLALAMSRIESEAERMGVIVEDLLLLANLDQGRPLGQEQFDLEAVLAEMVADHAMLHADWPISFGSSGGSDLVGDELRSRQAVPNLLAHAARHQHRRDAVDGGRRPHGRGQRQRAGYRRRRPAAPVRALLPRGRLARPPQRRQRVGARDRAGHRRGPWRIGRGGQRRGRGGGVHDPAADRGRDEGNP